MRVEVRDNNVDQALRVLKKKLQREGVYREMKLRKHFEKPSEKRARERGTAISHARKADRKRAERDKRSRRGPARLTFSAANASSVRTWRNGRRR